MTTMQMNEGLDTGDMILKTEIPLDQKETGGSLHDKLAEAGAKLCVETLKCLEDKTATWEPQGERARLHMQRCWIRILVILTGMIRLFRLSA